MTVDETRRAEWPGLGRLGYGGMSLTGAYGPIDPADAENLLSEVVDAGVTLIDTADVYGGGRSEEVIGSWLARTGRRSEITLASKVGIIRGGGIGRRGIRGDREHLRDGIEGSLRRLGVERLDLYYQHRIDPQVPVEETVGYLAELVAEGKVGSIGLSEATGEELRRASAVHPIAAIQSEWSLLSRDVEVSVVPAAAELGIPFVAFSPLSRGLLTDGFTAETAQLGDTRQNFPRFSEENLGANLAIANEVAAIAVRLGVAREQVAIAWLVGTAAAAGVRLVVLPGTRSIAHLRSDLAGLELELAPEDRAALDSIAARVAGLRAGDPLWVSGGREGLF